MTLAPQATVARLLQGWVNLLRADTAAAQQHFAAVLAAEPDHSGAYCAIALSGAIQGQTAQTMVSLVRSLALDPAGAAAAQARALLARGPVPSVLDFSAVIRELARESVTAKASAELVAQASLASRMPVDVAEACASSPGTQRADGIAPRAPKIAVLTPTCERPDFLAQTLRYVLAQDLPEGAQLHWFVLDDSAAPAQIDGLDDPHIHYRHLPRRMNLGAKRNLLNDMAKEWGADYFCAMDDDDWYGPSYVSSMVELLQSTGHFFAGSSKDYYFHVRTGTVLRVGAIGPGHSCNGVLCYRAEALGNGRRYDEHKRFGEEASFLRGAFVAQHPDVRKVHLALVHSGNTVSKEVIYASPACHTAMTLADFPMQLQDQGFYRALTCRVQHALAQPI